MTQSILERDRQQYYDTIFSYNHDSSQHIIIRNRKQLKKTIRRHHNAKEAIKNHRHTNIRMSNSRKENHYEPLQFVVCLFFMFLFPRVYKCQNFQKD